METAMDQKTEALAEALAGCDSVVIGAGAGMSTAAGLTYTGQRLRRYFGDFVRAYGFGDMYSGGFYPFSTPEQHWAYWSRYIWINRYTPIPNDAYELLLKLVEGRDYFALTTNVDHCFQRAGFSKKRLFYTQGDYGLFQCSDPCCNETWDNCETVKAMVEAQGFIVQPDGTLDLPEDGHVLMEVPGQLVPTCPHCGRPATMNLRADATFVEDEGWHEASACYGNFLRTRTENGQKVLFLELGVGYNTPIIIKYPFWQMTARNGNAVYGCVNRGEAYVPRELASQSVCIDGDIREVLRELTGATGRKGEKL